MTNRDKLETLKNLLLAHELKLITKEELNKRLELTFNTPTTH